DGPGVFGEQLQLAGENNWPVGLARIMPRKEFARRTMQVHGTAGVPPLPVQHFRDLGKSSEQRQLGEQHVISLEVAHQPGLLESGGPDDAPEQVRVLRIEEQRSNAAGQYVQSCRIAWG